MRLICGLLRLDGGAAEAGALAAMAAAMTGPGLSPALDTRLDGPLGLGVLDFGGARHTLFVRDGWTVAADARLDRDGPEPGPALVAAFERHGGDFPDRVDGDFAVALWHAGRGELLLGRDFIGVRPLAWTWRAGSHVAFASLPKGLHGSGFADPAIDPVALGCNLSQNYFRGSDTGFAAIAYLPAGHSLTLRADAGPPRPHRAYRPDPAQVGRWRGTPAEAAATLRRLVEEAVAARLPARGPVACHLTGGLDSSTVTVLAARAMRARGARVQALAVMAPDGPEPEDLDERPLIDAVLVQEPDLDFVPIPHSFSLPGRPREPDWPDLEDGINDLALAAAAARFGADRLLSGVGGDEGASYNGASPYARLLREGRLRALLREVPARARRDGISLGRTIRGRLIVPLLPARLRRLVLRRHGQLLLPDAWRARARVLNPAILDAVSRRRMLPILQANTPAERVNAFRDHHIPSRCTYYAIAAARHGLAVSFPLLDRRVVDFALSLPTSHFLADGLSRQPFRTAMEGILPDRVRLSRHKVGRAGDWLARSAAAKPALLAALEQLRAQTPPAVSGLFDLDAIGEGLALLPEPDETFERVCDRNGKVLAWRGQASTAVRCLNVACHLAQRHLAQRPAPEPGATPGC